MKKKIKKWLGLVLALALVVGSLPVAPLPVYAGSDAVNTLDKDKFHVLVPYNMATKISFGTKSRKGSEALLTLGMSARPQQGVKSMLIGIAIGPKFGWSMKRMEPSFFRKIARVYFLVKMTITTSY